MPELSSMQNYTFLEILHGLILLMYLPYFFRAVNLKASRGWVKRDDQHVDQYQTQKYAPSIYTHCYDTSGTRLFAAGGPLQCGLEGNYIGLWQ